MAIPDKRMTAAEVISELSSGMTIGIGGWGSRRKPMALVRELLRSDVTDLTIVTYGGPDVGLLCRAGKVRKVVSGFVSLDSIALEPHYRKARQDGSVEAAEWDEGMLLLGLRAAAWRLPFLPTRAGLGSDLLPLQPDIATVTSPYADAETGEFEDLVAVPALRLDAALIHMHRADQGGNAVFLNSDLYMDDWMAQAADSTYVSCERVVGTETLAPDYGFHTMRISRLMTTGVVETPYGAHFTECPPDYARDEAFQREYAGTAKSDEAWDEFRAKYLDVTEAEYLSAVGLTEQGGDAVSADDVTRAEICCVAVAEAFRGDGERLANPIGTIPMIGGRLARESFEPHLVMTDGFAGFAANPLPPGADPADAVVEAWNPYQQMFTVLWNGKRHVMMGATQVDRYGNQNIACIGDWHRPKSQLLGFRGAPGNTINHTTSYWVPNHGPRVLVPTVDVVCGVGYDRAAELPAVSRRFHEIRVVVTNLGVLDFETPDHRMRLRSVHPGVSVDEVVEATGFELVIPSDVPESRPPTDDELRLIREVIDPAGLREREVPSA